MQNISVTPMIGVIDVIIIIQAEITTVSDRNPVSIYTTITYQFGKLFNNLLMGRIGLATLGGQI